VQGLRKDPTTLSLMYATFPCISARDYFQDLNTYQILKEINYRISEKTWVNKRTYRVALTISLSRSQRWDWCLLVGTIGDEETSKTFSLLSAIPLITHAPQPPPSSRQIPFHSGVHDRSLPQRQASHRLVGFRVAHWCRRKRKGKGATIFDGQSPIK
jgi:hypothetical protein